MKKSYFFIPLAAILVLSFLAVPDVKAQSQDQEPGTWQMVDNENDPMNRHENAYARVGDKFYLIGGRGEWPVEIYDPATGTWETGATPPLSMHHCQAVSYDGKVYILAAFNGGYPDETPISNVYIYDPESDSWTKGPEIPEQYRRGAAGAVAHEGKIYVVGGSRNGHIGGHVRQLDSFDPATGEWESLAKPPRFRDHFHAAVVNGKLYAAGGRRTSQASGRVFELTIPEVDVYDFSTGEWSPLPPTGDLPTERAGTTAISVGKYLLVLGGESGSQQPAHDEVEALNTDSGTWESLAPMNQGRHGFQAVMHDGKIYVAAGSRTRGATEINSEEVYVIPDSLE